nr:helix-turn-helix domain-containing protein [uncultured Sphingobacterium sp.]
MVKEITKLSFKDYLSEKAMDNRLYQGLIMYRSTKAEIQNYLCRRPIRIDHLGICLIRKGRLKLSLNFVDHILDADTMYFLSPMVVMQVMESSDDIEMYTLFTEFDFFQKIGLPVYKVYSMEKLGHEDDTILKLDKSDSNRFYQYLMNLEYQNTAPQDVPFRLEIIKMTLMLLFYEISAKVSSKLERTSAGFERKNRMVMEFLNLASLHFKTNRSVQYYADRLFISRKHLTRIVKDVTGFGPKAILEEIVISEAVILMNVSSMSVKDVMQELNFSDFGTFSKFFKGHLGQSPLLYRSHKNG